MSEQVILETPIIEYTHVEPTTHMNICLIDENVNIRTIHTIKLHKDNYIEQT